MIDKLKTYKDKSFNDISNVWKTIEGLFDKEALVWIRP
jgi:hypothetical protein